MRAPFVEFERVVRPVRHDVRADYVGDGTRVEAPIVVSELVVPAESDTCIATNVGSNCTLKDSCAVCVASSVTDHHDKGTIRSEVCNVAAKDLEDSGRPTVFGNAVPAATGSSHGEGDPGKLTRIVRNRGDDIDRIVGIAGVTSGTT